MTQIELRGIWRDYWGRWDSKSSGHVADLNDPERFRPSFYSVPSRLSQTLAAGEYAQAQISITPGSFVWGLAHPSAADFVFQITDLSLGHEWFNQPISDYCIESAFWPLPEPYPVVYPGLFRIEVWNGFAGSATCELILCVAEFKGHESSNRQQSA